MMEQVYIFDFGDKIKAGYSTNVQKRLRTIELSSGVEAKQVYSVQAGRAVEKELHKRLENRLVGEFFAFPFERAKELLDEVVANYEPPVASIKASTSNSLTAGEKIKTILGRRNLTLGDLAEKTGQSRQNLSNKMGRDNFSEKELLQISQALDCTFLGAFTMNDTGEVI